MPSEQPGMEKPRVVLHFGRLFSSLAGFEIRRVDNMVKAPVYRKRKLGTVGPVLPDADILSKQRRSDTKSDDHGEGGDDGQPRRRVRVVHGLDAPICTVLPGSELCTTIPGNRAALSPVTPPNRALLGKPVICTKPGTARWDAFKIMLAEATPVLANDFSQS